MNEASAENAQTINASLKEKYSRITSFFIRRFWTSKRVTGRLFRFLGEWPKLSLSVFILFLLGILIYRDLTSSEIVLDPIEITASLQSQLSSSAVTKQLLSEVLYIRRQTNTSFNRDGTVVDVPSLTPITLKSGPFELSTVALSDLVRELIKRPRQRITGVVISDAQKPGAIHIMLYTPSHEAVDCDSKIDLNDGLLTCAERLSTALSPYPMAAYFFQRRRWEEAREQSLKVIRSQNPDERKWGYILYGQLCAQEQDLETARNNYEAALGLDPKFSVAWVNLGNLELLGKSPDPKKAEDDYRTAMRLQPMDAIAASDLGDLMETNGNPQEAEKFYKLAVSFDPNLANAYSGLGSLAAKNGDMGSAKAWFGHAIQLSVSKADPYIQWGNIYLQQKQYDAAEIRFQWATSADKSNKLAWAALASTLAIEDKYPEAREAILNALPDWFVPIAKATKPGQMKPNMPAALLAVDLVVRPYDFSQDKYCFDIYFLLERHEKAGNHTA